MTTIKITHAQRAFLAMELLKKEINNHKIERFKIYSTCIFIKGDTAQKKTFQLDIVGMFSLFQQHSVIHKFTATCFFKLLK